MTCLDGQFTTWYWQPEFFFHCTSHPKQTKKARPDCLLLGKWLLDGDYKIQQNIFFITVRVQERGDGGLSEHDHDQNLPVCLNSMSRLIPVSSKNVSVQNRTTWIGSKLFNQVICYSCNLTTGAHKHSPRTILFEIYLSSALSYPRKNFHIYI